MRLSKRFNAVKAKDHTNAAIPGTSSFRIHLPSKQGSHHTDRGLDAVERFVYLFRGVSGRDAVMAGHH